jgi:hypothetical protein
LPSQEKTTEQIRSVVRQLIQAVETRDRVLLDKLLRREYVYITDDAQRFSREQCLGVLEHQTAFELLELEPIKVISHGKEATASYVATGDGLLDGRPIRGMFRIDQKMICERGKWQIAETHTKIVAPLY